MRDIESVHILSKQFNSQKIVTVKGKRRFNVLHFGKNWVKGFRSFENTRM